MLTLIIIIYIVTLPPQDFLANEHEKIEEVLRKIKKNNAGLKYNLHITETDFLRTAACTWKAIWFGGCHVGGLESQHADGVLSRTHLKAKNVL